ncbi:FixJ family two-component response regulator [Microvirga lupini]|uniref:FixJ family two-component response regulator n=1 Tax=Microvirga lupini TaxID=420324 RepID=A0A7W4VPA6_9HYPH|nr:response regulator [Microvirga lupini]MBB3020817.1 FixJ family two-component response regulator [Microvirga lupini]
MPGIAECVLVVDDDLAVRESLRFALEMEGLTVRTYGGGAELLADPDLASCGCLVIDCNMPGMNGIELVERLEERHQHCPVILITSGSARGVAECGVHPDIMEVLEKPLEDDALLDHIRAALAAARTRTRPRGNP